MLPLNLGPGVTLMTPTTGRDTMRRMKAKRVLIVDDNSGFRSFARRLLQADGFDVVGEAQDGRAAVAAVADLRPEIVLLDVQLPDFDGFEVLRKLAEQGTASRVVLTSSRDAADYGRKIPASGAAGFIPKAELSGRALTGVLVKGSEP
jgi:DNA-binding NarL/FixJ family response regulator